MGEGVEIRLVVRAVVVVGCRAQGRPVVVLDKVVPPEWQKAGPCWNPSTQGCDARSEKVGCGHCGAVVRDWSVLYCLGGEGAGTGGVFGGGEKAEVVVPVIGWTPNGVGWVGCVGSSLIDSDLISGKSGSSTLMAGNV